MKDKTGEMEMVFCASTKECTHHRIELLRAMFEIDAIYRGLSVRVDADGTIVVWAFR
jgi:hypothetical protein